jgi:integrase
MAERKAVKTAQNAAKVNSFASVSALLAGTLAGRKNARHADSVRRRMEADILPALGRRPVDAIEAPEVVAMAKAIEQRGALEIAKRALETTGQIFRYAIVHGYAKRNPAGEIKPSDILNPSARPTTPESTPGTFRTYSRRSRYTRVRTSPVLPSSFWR